MNAANIAKSDGEFDPAFLPVVITYMLLATFILMAVVKQCVNPAKAAGFSCQNAASLRRFVGACLTLGGARTSFLLIVPAYRCDQIVLLSKR